MSASSRQLTPWLTWRAILLGLCLMPVLTAWNYQVEVVYYCFATYAAPFYNVVAILAVLTAFNLLVKRLAPKLALAPGELIIVYVMLSLQGALCSHNMMEILITMLAHPAKFATPENKWGELFLERLPTWAYINDPAVFEDYYLGNSTFWTREHLLGWLRPALVWSTFTAVLLGAMLCLNLILRRRWIEHERLSYPVLQLPLALVQQPESLLRNPMLWGGFTVAALLALMAGLQEILPAIPSVPVGRRSMAAMFAVPPWTVLRGMRWAIYPWAIGIGFLIPLDLSVSCWLFYFAFCAERVLGSQLGWMAAGGFPWAEDQAFGAYCAFLVMGLWVGRRDFADVLRQSLQPWRPTDDPEARTHRWAVWGLFLCVGWLIWFSTKLGMQAGMALLFFVIYYAMATMITRIRAELGFPTHDMHYMNPPEVLCRLLPPQAFGPANLTAFTSYFWFNRTYASHPMPHQLEGYKMCEATRTRSGPLTLAMIIAGLCAPWFVFLIVPHFYYQLGSATGNVNTWGTQFGHQGFGRLASWLQSPVRYDPSHFVATGFGFAMAIALGAVRVRLIGWPLHPLAYAIANSWGMEQLWLPLIIASLVKWAMLKGGGLATYRRWVPFFLGLILGDFISGSLWNFAGMIFDYHPYDFWPGIIK